MVAHYEMNLILQDYFFPQDAISSIFIIFEYFFNRSYIFRQLAAAFLRTLVSLSLVSHPSCTTLPNIMFLSTENVDNYHMHHYAVTHFVTFFPNLPLLPNLQLPMH